MARISFRKYIWASFQLAVDDVDLSLASGYPADKAFKLYERKGECLHQLSKSPSKDNDEKKALAEKAVEAFRSDFVLADVYRIDSEFTLRLWQTTTLDFWLYWLFDLYRNILGYLWFRSYISVGY